MLYSFVHVFYVYILINMYIQNNNNNNNNIPSQLYVYMSYTHTIEYSHVWREETVGDTKIVVTSTQDTNTTPYTTPFETWALFAQWSHGERVRSFSQTSNRSIFYFNSKHPSHRLGHKLSRFMRRSDVAGQWFGRRDG